MPTVFTVDGLRFFFWSNEGAEPPHVHVERDDDAAKFWLNPVELAENYGLKKSDVKRATNVIVTRREEILEAWRAHFARR